MAAKAKKVRKIKIKTGVRAGTVTANRNSRKLVVKTGVRSGALTNNHNAIRL
jgi:hypothetical protein